MSIEVNGVSLPDIPSDVLAQYPYAFVVYIINDYTEQYNAVCTTEQFWALPADLGAGKDVLFPPDMITTYTGLSIKDGDSEWENLGGDTDANYIAQLEDGMTVVWSNYDIMAAEMDATTGAPVATDTVWFANTAVDPLYYTNKSWFDGMAQQVMRLTGTSDKLTTDEMLAALKALELTGGGAEMFLVKTTGVLDASVGQLTIDHTTAEMIAAHNSGQTVLFELTPETLSALYGATMTEAFILRPCAFNSDGSYFQFQGVGATVKDTGTTTFTVTSVTCNVNNSGVAYCTMSNIEASGYTTA